MRRIAPCLLLLAAVSFADDAALVESSGKGLADFAVEVHLDRVRKDSAEALAGSVARLFNDLERIKRQWREWIWAGHVAALRRTCTVKIVAHQERQYILLGQTMAAPVFAVESVTPDGEGKARARISGDVERLLTLEADGDTWHVAQVHERHGTNWVPRPALLPRPRGDVEVPPARDADRATPEACVASLRYDLERLGKAARSAEHRLQRHYPTMLGMFHGKEPEQPAPAVRPYLFEIGKAQARIGNRVRVDVGVFEPVEEGDERKSAIGHHAFDLGPDPDGKWIVVAEFRRPAPDEPLGPVRDLYALVFFLAGRDS